MQLADLQQAAAATVTDPVQWYDLVGKFKQKVAEFQAAWAELMSEQSFVASHPSLQTDFNYLVGLGQTLKSKIQSATSLIDQTVKMAGNLWSSISTTFTNVFGDIEEPPQLGFLPLIPIAVIAASVAAIAYFVTEVYKFKTKVDQIKKLEAQGMTAQQAIATAGNVQPGMLSQLKGIALPLAAVTAFVVGVHFIEQRRNN